MTCRIFAKISLYLTRMKPIEKYDYTTITSKKS